jgi:glycosyltransferase involved in cell wall biosynthesis
LSDRGRAAGVSLAYIASRYPFLSHTFILREVLALRRAGASVDTYTVRRPEVADLRTPEDQEAFDTTDALVPPRTGQLVIAHLWALLTRPRRYLATLKLALGMRGPGARSALWQLFYFGEGVLMWHKCRRRAARHIHAHHGNVASDVALLATSLGGRGWSWSFTLHGPTELFAVAENRLPQKTELADFVICISDFARSQLMGMVGTEHWEKLHVVHCAVDLSRFELVDRRARDGAVEIVNIGRAVPEKGQAILIQAVAELARRGVGARLTVVGDGPQLPELRALAERLGVAGSVEFAGAVGQGEILSYYERADVFAMPSFAEGIPVVLMEAMATGLPVVSTRIAGIPELVEDGRSGYVVAPGRVDELASALERVLGASGEERASMGHAGRAKVEAEFALEPVAAQLLEIFRKPAHRTLQVKEDAHGSEGRED